MFSDVMEVISEWYTIAVPTIRIGIVAIMAALSILIISVVLSLGSVTGGDNVLSGVRESFYASNKGSSKEGRLKRLLFISGIAFVVLTVLYFVL